jgi:hypothetical protein
LPYTTTPPKVTTKARECVSVDQLDVTIPGLIAQLHIYYATVSVDHYIWLGYVYLQQTLSSDNKCNAKRDLKILPTAME